MDFDDSTATGDSMQMVEPPRPSRLPWVLLALVTVALGTASLLLLVRSLSDAEDATRQYVEAQKHAARAEKAEQAVAGQLARIAELEEQARRQGEERAALKKELDAAKREAAAARAAPPPAAKAPQQAPAKKAPTKKKRRK